MKKRIAIFASGNGSNFEALAKACLDGRIDADPAFCLTDHPGAYVVERARRLGVTAIELSPKAFASKREYEEEVLRNLESANVDFIFLAGYMRIVGEVLLKAYKGRIINIHPSLLPAFPGLDAIGQAMDYGVKVYGVTIHFVDETLDGGKIIDQAAIHYEGDSRDELEPKIHELEHKLYIETAARIVREFPQRANDFDNKD